MGTSDFLSFMQSEGLSKRKAIQAQAEEFTNSLAQQIKNESAPKIAGGNYSGGITAGGSGSGAWSTAGGKLDIPKMSGKVLPTGARISQGWGKSRIRYAAGRHTGIDFGGPVGTRINSAASGVVVGAGRDGAYGNAIKIRHGDGTTALYGHLSGINVKPGQKVKAGQAIGKMGNTGRSFGSHLHFEVRKTDKYGGDINPKSWFSTR